jgi:protocatechuate 3,4-dioxygenase beta subunit
VTFDKLDYIDTLPGFGEPGPNIEISGIIYRKDGKTPAPGVVLYIYHTDQSGLYSNKLNQPGWAKRHGSLRGWIRTNEKGEYRFYTQIPASYPNSNNPKHIHPTIKEPGLNEYWIDEFVFADDPLFQQPNPGQKARGGSGVLHPELKDGLYRAKRDIILGLNVPGYPG